MDIIWRLALERPDCWNKVYAADNPIFTDKPNALLASVVEGRRPGKALDVGMGQGRNSIFLALLGWDVTGIDPSDVGMRIAQANAQKTGVKIHTIATTDREFDFGDTQWDLVVYTYIRSLTSNDAQRLERALRPGGIVVYENGGVGNEVLRAFLGFRIVRFEDVEAFGDWKVDQRMRIQKLVAEKVDKP